MPALYFDEILTKGVRSGKIPARTQDARNWYRDTASKVGRVRDQKSMLKSDTERLSSTPIPGQMYMFFYDPKWKEELPYYDRFPLIFPFKKIKGGFLWLNLHYLPLQLRAQLMDELYKLANNTRYDESTRIKMSYELLAGAQKLRFFQPCIKHYLDNHVTSQFMYVYPSEWAIALFLPTEQFAKKSKSQVWADSKRTLGIRK